MKKAQAGKKVVKKPTYKNLRMGVANQSKAEGRDYTEKATKQDSINYNRGFARGLKKDKETRWDIDEVEKMGRWEGLNTKKSGGPVKKAKSGASLGMKSVKAGFDKNPGITRADIITAATKKAQAGKTLPIKKSKVKGNPAFELEYQKFKNEQEMRRMKLEKEQKAKEASYPKSTKAKSGASMKNKGPKKAALGALLPLAMKAAPMVAGMLGGGKGKSGGMGGMLGGLLGGKNGKNVNKAKSGGSMKKCKYGCK